MLMFTKRLAQRPVQRGGRSIALGVLLSWCLHFQCAFASGVSQYGIASGNVNGEFNPVLHGGAFDGRTVGSLSIHDIAGYRNSATAELALLSTAGISTYGIGTGNLNGEFNPVLNGGAFDGRTVSSLSINEIAAFRTGASAELALLSTAGISTYGIGTGNLNGEFNPVLNGGAFDGRTIGSLSIEEIAGVSDAASAELALFSASGISRYGIASGNVNSEFNPVLHGGAFDGRTVGSLSIHDIAGYRNSATAELALFTPVPEPSTFCIACSGALLLLAWLRLSR